MSAIQNTIVTWNDNQIHHHLKDIKKTNYGDGMYTSPTPDENAIAVSRLLMAGIPGNTLDVILDRIAKEFKGYMDNPVCLDMMKNDDFDIQSRLRCVLYEIAKINEL